MNQSQNVTKRLLERQISVLAAFVENYLLQDSDVTKPVLIDFKTLMRTYKP